MGWINPADSDEIIEKPKNIESDIRSIVAQINNKSAKTRKSEKLSYESKAKKGRNDRKTTFWCHFRYV